jgi:hypothetical protein
MPYLLNVVKYMPSKTIENASQFSKFKVSERIIQAKIAVRIGLSRRIAATNPEDNRLRL